LFVVIHLRSDKLITPMWHIWTSREKTQWYICASLCNATGRIRLYYVHRLSALLLFATELCKCVCATERVVYKLHWKITWVWLSVVEKWRYPLAVDVCCIYCWKRLLRCVCVKLKFSATAAGRVFTIVIFTSASVI
jgi:hypothetical protein